MSGAPPCPLTPEGIALLRTLLVREHEQREARRSLERAEGDLRRAEERHATAYKAVLEACPADAAPVRVAVTLGEGSPVYALTVSRRAVVAELLPGLVLKDMPR